LAYWFLSGHSSSKVVPLNLKCHVGGFLIIDGQCSQGFNVQTFYFFDIYYTLDLNLTSNPNWHLLSNTSGLALGKIL